MGVRDHERRARNRYALRILNHDRPRGPNELRNASRSRGAYR
jgi:hypothetical protein